MPRPLRQLALLLVLLLSLAGARAEAPPQISLLTFAPGEIYWQRFGHNALLVQRNGEARVYNYGIFDFRQKNFALNFARGEMRYRLAAEPLADTLWLYQQEGRWVQQQVLALDPAQARALAAFLEHNARPENAEYRYDYFLSNCSTRVRDALDQATQGALRRALQGQPSGTDYRREVTALIAPAGLALALGMDLGLGPLADAPIDRWAHGFLPLVLMQAVREVQLAPGRALVAAEASLLGPVDERPAPAAPDPFWAFLLIGPLLALLLAAAAARRPGLYRASAAGLALLLGLGGLILAAGWAFSAHWAVWRNATLLLLNPLWWALLPALLSGRRGRASRALAVLIALGGVLALPLAGLQDQRIGHWWLLLAPLQAVLLLGLLRPRPQSA